jgi:hypothetical protein
MKTRRYQRNPEREARQAALEAQADEILRRAERRRIKRKPPAPASPLPDKGWLKLADLKRALAQQGTRKRLDAEEGFIRYR